MTREEAIQILADLIDSPFLHTWEKQNKALHMAIEALSREQKKYDAICDELLELKSDLLLPIEVAMAVVMKYAKRGGSE